MRFVIFMICFYLLSLGCNKDRCEVNSENCDFQNLVVCDSTSVDLEKYTVRTNGFSFGYANAVKQVSSAGEIAWMANCIGISFNEQDFYISFSTYDDTSWVGLEYWAYLREVILIKVNIEPGQKQILKPEFEHKIDSSLLYANYTKNIDDVKDAKWDIDPDYESYIIITEFDSITNKVNGVFDLNFVKTMDNTHSGETYADKVRFRCGNFEGKFQ